MKSFRQYLEELYIQPNNRAKYGQIIFLVGGAASGKSTATKKFIETANYKILNPDDVKELMVKAGQAGMPSYADIKDVDPNSPEGSQILHQKMRDTRVSSKRARALISSKGRGQHLPNILFDRTFSFAGEFQKISQNLVSAGYDPNNIHVVFVFTELHISLERNKARGRTLPDEVIVSTNRGAKERFSELFFGRAKGASANGDYYIIINRGERAIQVKEAGKRVDTASDIAKSVAELLGKRRGGTNQ